MKTCTLCKKEKPLKEFYVNKEYKGGRVSRCIQCTKEQSRVSYRKHHKIDLPSYRLPNGKLIKLNFCPIKNYKKFLKLQKSYWLYFLNMIQCFLMHTIITQFNFNYYRTADIYGFVIDPMHYVSGFVIGKIWKILK